MKDAVLSALFKIPDPITADEFSRRTGKTESAVRHMMDRRLLPMVTEREVLGVLSITVRSAPNRTKNHR